MATNPYVNKVVFGNQTVLDLTSDTVEADKLLEGYTAHDATGELIQGTYVPSSGSTPKLLRYNRVRPELPPNTNNPESYYINATTEWQKLLPASVTRWAVGIRVNDTNVQLGLDYENEETPTTVNIATISSSYTNGFFVKQVIVISPYQFLIVYVYKTGSAAYYFSEHLVRLITIKNNKAFIMQYGGILSKSTSSSTSAKTKYSYGFLIPKTDPFRFIAIRMDDCEVSTGIVSNGNLRAEHFAIKKAGTSTGFVPELYGRGSSATLWDSGSVVNSNNSAKLLSNNIGVCKFGFIYSLNPDYPASEVYRIYFDPVYEMSMSDNFAHFRLSNIFTDLDIKNVLGMLKNGEFVFSNQDYDPESLTIEIYIYAFWWTINGSNNHFVKILPNENDYIITKSSADVFIVGMQNDIIVLSDGARYQIAFNDDNTFSLQELSSVETVSELCAPMRAEGKSYNDVSADSDPYSNMYLEGSGGGSVSSWVYTVAVAAPNNSNMSVIGGGESLNGTGKGLNSYYAFQAHKKSTPYSVSAEIDEQEQTSSVTTGTEEGLISFVDFHFALITLTYTDDFKGEDITFKNGNIEVVKTAPSDSNEMIFYASAIGNWIVSGTISGRTYSTTVVISSLNDSVTANLRMKAPMYSFATATDEQLAAMLESYYNDEYDSTDINELLTVYLPVGAKRTIHLNYMAAQSPLTDVHHADNYVFTIIGQQHDNLTTPINGKTKALITINQDRILYKNITDETYNTDYPNVSNEGGQMNTERTNVGGWTSCPRRTWCNDIYYNALPSGIKGIVKPVNKLSSAGNNSATIVTTSDNIFLLSHIEVTGNGSTPSYEGEGTQYSYFTTATNRYKKPSYSTSGVSAHYWLRSPYKNARDFCKMGSSGAAGSANSTYANGLTPAFCL